MLHRMILLGDIKYDIENNNNIDKIELSEQIDKIDAIMTDYSIQIN